MTEIRVRWSVQTKTDQDGNVADGGHWHPDSPGNRQMLQVIVESSNEIYGAGTHWVEVRPLTQKDRERLIQILEFPRNVLSTTQEI